MSRYNTITSGTKRIKLLRKTRLTVGKTLPATRLLILLLAATLIILLWSNIMPKDRLTWFLEVAPVLIALPLLTYTWQSFPLTPLLYKLIFVHAIILMVGGHYTYAEVPAGFWVQDMFDLNRNHYDRLGHFAQGFVPAILAREILLRKTPLQPGKMLFYIVASLCLAFSAFYELVEWWAALLYGGAADAFLSTQGDIWDTQADMFTALIGAISAQLLLSKRHDKQLKEVLSVKC
jgi:putative membrane protein